MKVLHFPFKALIKLRAISWTIRKRLSRKNPIPINYFFSPTMQLYPKGQIARLAYVQFFERRYLRFALHYCSAGMVAIDVGANIGLWSISLAQKVRPFGKVYAFEPSTDMVTLLRKNLILNGCNNLVDVCPVALGNHQSSAFLLTPQNGGDADRFLKLCSDSDEDSNERRINETVPVVTLDHWLTDKGIREIQFAKIDCEGSELFVLQGANETLHRTRSALLICECNPVACARQEYKPSDLYDFLEKAGFQLGYLSQRTNRFVSKRPSDEFAGNFIAIKGIQ